jgi:nucleoid-associated protein YgaU
MELLAILRDGSWGMLAAFAEKQKASQDLSPARRQRFLMEYIKKKSKAAAYVMLKTDGDFAVKKLDDATVLQMLELLTSRTQSAEKFAIALLSNPRSDAVWQSAAARLYDYLGEPQPERLDPQAILSRFVPKAKWKAAPKNSVPVKPAIAAPAPQPAATPPAPIKREKLYIVQEGDSYWKIAKKFKIDINTLKSYNNVQNDFLKPGMSLKIP